jgi:hypothetical protein
MLRVNRARAKLNPYGIHTNRDELRNPLLLF